ncbi:MAG: hypothetical protein V3V62_03700 [bacterium]
MSRRATFRIALSLAALLLLGGCFRLPKSLRFPSSTKKKVADPRKYRFPDLPVPAGLDLSVEDSFIFEAPGTRAGHLVYRGGRKYEAVVRFYREKMPEHGWRLVSSFERGQATLTFEKPGWVISIIVSSKVLGSQVDINIGPKAKGFVEKDIPKRR